MPSNNEDDMITCQGCRDLVHVDDSNWSEYDEMYRCNSCHDDHVCEMEEQENEEEDSGLVHSYSYKPTPIFLNDDGVASYYVTASDDGTHSVLYQGFELEVEVGGRSNYMDCASSVIDTINGRHNDIVYLKEDGSIQHGFEIVSHPMTLGFAMNHFKWEGISNLIRKGCKSWDTDTCGLHIHLSRSAFQDEKHLFKFFKFIMDNETQMKKFAGRSSERWASFSKEVFLNGWNDYDEDGNYVPKYGNSIMQHAKGESMNNSRYCAINLHNRKTVELRFFRPSLSPNTVKSAMQLCDAVFHYTKTECDTKRVMSANALSFRSFTSWVNTKSEYAQCADRIATRCDINN